MTNIQTENWNSTLKEFRQNEKNASFEKGRGRGGFGINLVSFHITKRIPEPDSVVS